MKAYLLAAGYATRLFPLTRDRPKPLLEVGGRPLLGHLVHRLRDLEGLSEIVVIGNARFAPQLEDWCARVEAPAPVRLLNDGSTSDDDKLGAIGDLLFAIDAVPPAGEDWLVAAGDNLLAFDLRPLQRRFDAQRDPMLVLRRVSPGGGPSPYNEVTLGADGTVARFREKPADPRTDLAAIALYFFPPGVAELLRRYVGEGHPRDAPGHFISWLVTATRVRGESLQGEWFDIGSHETLAAARARFESGETDRGL